jgi:Flp pilus assembly protein TadD
MPKLLNSLNLSLLTGVLLTVTGSSLASLRDDILSNLREGQLAQAAKLVAAERKNKPKDVDIWFLEGVVQAQSGQTDKAVATFTRITQAHPHHAKSYNNPGVLAAAKGQLGEARAFFQKALRTNPSYAAVHKNLGDVNSQLAKAAYGKALMVDSKYKPASVQLSMLA